MQKVKVDNMVIPYSVSRRTVKYPRLEFKTGDLVVVLPKGKKSAREVVEKHKNWIREKKQAINDAMLKSRKKRLNFKRSEESFRNLVAKYVREFKEKYGFLAKNIFFRKMNSKWASHSSKGNLTINDTLRFLPERLVRYVLFHELAHSRERKHNKKFWKIVELEFKDHQKMEKELMIYWFILQKV
ncbi:DUF45 domain-containing protein [Candidatus Micrarchaeota archaeon]|nr:DUF45 domain-containing protein [Candidatus Micrarchaeota archaeon]